MFGLAAVLAAVLATGACRSGTPRVAGVPDQVDFNFHVKPILSDRCFKCHGPDDRQRKAGLRLDVKDVAFGALASGRRAIVPGKTGTQRARPPHQQHRSEGDDAGPRIPPHPERD